MRRTLSQATALLALIAATAALAQQIPPTTDIHKDITYAIANGKPLKLDLYLPTSAQQPMPVIVRLAPHRESPARPANELLAKGYALIYAGYLPDDASHGQSFNRFPADLHAAKAAIRWTHGNASAQHLDPARIAVWGSDQPGGGATLASLLAVTPDQPALNGTLGDFTKEPNSVRAVCLFGGTTDWRNAELYGDETVNTPGSPAYQLFGANPKENPDDARTASAVNYIRPTSPATLMVTLASDSNRAMHLIYAETLRRAGVPSALYEEPPGSGSGLGGRAVDEAKLDQTILAFFNDTLGADHPPAKMPLDQEIQQLSTAGLYKQARRLIEEQIAITTGPDRQHWLTLLRQTSDQQREPALQKLAASMKQHKTAPHAQWTIREVLTNPERIGEYQVEATLSQETFDVHAKTLKQIESLNQFVLEKDWTQGDQLYRSIRADLSYHDEFQAAALNEFLPRYSALKSHPNQSSPPDVQPVAFAAAFGQDLYGYWFDLRAGGALQRFRYIPPGTYARGSSPDEWGRLPGEPPQISTNIKDGFWISDSPITQQMLEGVVGSAANHSHFRGPTLPADSLSYANAINFINKFGVDARLPTPAEWEYAARAGSRAPYPATGRPSDIAWFWDEAASENTGMNIRILNELETDRTPIARSTHPVKQKLPNKWGLYDMQGNVWEWCSGTSPEKPRDYHPLRGGSWISIPQSCRAAREAWAPVETESWNIGLRIIIPAQ